MIARMLIPLCAAAALLWGSNFWDAKPFSQWNEKEVNRVMGDSPWAKTTSTVVDLSKMKELAAAAAPQGTPPGKGGGRGGPGGGGAPPMLELLVRWQSSLTVRQAMVRGQFGDEAGTSEKAAEFLARPQRFYALAVTRLPMRFFRNVDPQQFQKMLAEGATLNVKGLETMRPADIQFQSTEQVLTIFFAFPREQEITVEHREAEFIAQIGPVQVKRKFRLSDMVRDGKLDL